MRFQTTLFVFVAVLVLMPSAHADEVIKKDGKSVKGFVVGQDSRLVRIMDAKGRTHRIAMKDVDSILEGPDTGDKETDAKLEEIDSDDADEVAEVATAAKASGNKVWKVLAMMALRIDEDHSEAHELLGHILVGDAWFTSKKKADTARRKLVAEQMKEDGFLRWRSGWISKEDRALASKDPKAYVKDDNDVWRNKAEFMREKGFELVGEKWIPGGTAEDKADRAKFKELTGEKIWVVTTDHFRLYVMDVPPEEVTEFGELVEKTYAWFIEQMGLDKGTNVFRGNNKAHMWVLKDRPTAVTWFKNYRERFSLSDGFGKLVSQSGNCFGAEGLIDVGTPEGGRERLRHRLVNHAAQFAMKWYSPGLRSAGKGKNGDFSYWLYESFGVHAEHELLGNGVIVHSTLAKYGGSAGRADKAFETKDANERCEGYVRRGADALENIDNLQDLNMLSGDHIAKGYTILRWLMTEKLEEFRNWVRERNKMRSLEALAKTLGLAAAQVDKKWREMARDGF